MSRQAAIAAAYVALMIVVIVLVDVLFFRHHAWQRLFANIGLVVAFAAVFLLVVRHR